MLPLHYVPIQWTLSVPTRVLKLFRLTCAPATPKVHLLLLVLLDVSMLAAQFIDFLLVLDSLVQGTLRMTVQDQPSLVSLEHLHVSEDNSKLRGNSSVELMVDLLTDVLADQLFHLHLGVDVLVLFNHVPIIRQAF